MARLQRPADQQNASNVVGTFEQVVKMLGFVLGGFDALGSAIANAELQHLGLSDFSILQPRCIATGMLFALYIIFAMLLLAPVAVLFVVGFILLVDSSKPRMARIGLALGLIAACVVLECVFALLTSLFYGSLTPWVVMNAPETYEAYSKLSFSERMDLLANQLRFVWRFCLVIRGRLSLRPSASFGSERKLQSTAQISTDGQEEDRVLLGALVVVVLVFAVTGFAGDVYPNLNQSVGGVPAHYRKASD